MFQIFLKKFVTSTKICNTKIVPGQKFVTIVKKCNRKTKFETYFFKKIGSALFWFFWLKMLEIMYTTHHNFFGSKNISEHRFFRDFLEGLLGFRNKGGFSFYHIPIYIYIYFNIFCFLSDSCSCFLIFLYPLTLYHVV